jgi:hypothetical protein
MTRNTLILLLGFRRPEFIEKRLSEMSAWIETRRDILVSVDGQEEFSGSSISKKFRELELKYPSVNWIQHSKNLGISNHLVRQLDECLKVRDNVIVIEDDISVTMNSLKAIEEALSQPSDKSIMTVGLFGSLPNEISIFSHHNSWRKTKYFSAWGWGIQKEAWQIYDQNIVRRYGLNALKSSQIWQELNDAQRRRWLHRFTKVMSNPSLTWDFQMQFTSFVNNLYHLLPKYRLCDNVGFDDLRATNTKNRRPNWYRGTKTDKTPDKAIPHLGHTQTKILEKIDSYTWIGDRKPFDRSKRI